MVIAKLLNANKMKLECLLCLAYIQFTDCAWKEATELFNQAYLVAKNNGENVISEQCLCNAGIASTNQLMDGKETMKQAFYKNGCGFSTNAHPIPGFSVFQFNHY